MVVCCNMLWRDATCCTEVCVQVHTPNEVFQAMVDLGQSVVYRRIPVVDSFSWSDSDFDDLLSALKVGRCLRVECPGIHIPTRTPRPNTSQPAATRSTASLGLCANVGAALVWTPLGSVVLRCTGRRSRRTTFGSSKRSAGKTRPRSPPCVPPARPPACFDHPPSP